MAVDIKTVSAKASVYAAQVRKLMPLNKVYIWLLCKRQCFRIKRRWHLFFLDSFDGKRRVDIIKELLKLTIGYDDVGFEPVVLPSSELNNGNPFAMEVISTGIEI